MNIQNMMLFEESIKILIPRVKKDILDCGFVVSKRNNPTYNGTKPIPSPILFRDINNAIIVYYTRINQAFEVLLLMDDPDDWTVNVVVYHHYGNADQFHNVIAQSPPLNEMIGIESNLTKYILNRYDRKMKMKEGKCVS